MTPAGGKERQQPRRAPREVGGRRERGRQGKPEPASHREQAHPGRSAVAAGEMGLAGRFRVKRRNAQAAHSERRQAPPRSAPIGPPVSGPPPPETRSPAITTEAPADRQAAQKAAGRPTRSH